MPRDRTYFAFASGRFDYDCVSCGFTCCRGHGYQVHAGDELHGQVRGRPALAIFLERKDSEGRGILNVLNCKPSCFFLNSDGRCDIQRTDGYVSKPETCRLFPFNYLRHVEHYLVVAPHLGLCPLRVAPDGGTAGASCHDNLFADMATQGVHAGIPAATGLVRDVSALVALERSIVSMSEEYLSAAAYEAFVAAQCDATRDASIWNVCRTAPAVPTREETWRWLRLVCEVLGACPRPEYAEHPTLIRTMVASTPALRSLLVFRQPDRMPGHSIVPLERVPYVLLALHTLAALALEAGMTAVSYQTLMGLYRDHGPLLRMLAYVDCVMTWHPAGVVELAMDGGPDNQRRYIRIIQAIMSTAAIPRSLGRILCDNATQEQLDRSVFLRAVARRLADRLVPVSQESDRRPTAREIKCAVQRWVLSRTNENLLIAVADRQRRSGRQRLPHAASSAG